MALKVLLKWQMVVMTQMSKGITKEEINRLFEYLEQSKTNNQMTVLIDNGMCKTLYDLFINCYEYQKILEQRIDKSLRLLKAFGGGKIIISDVIDILKGGDE